MAGKNGSVLVSVLKPDMGRPFKAKLRAEVEVLEMKLIVAALESVNWHESNAAKNLGMPRNSLNFKMIALGIPRAREWKRAQKKAAAKA